MAIWKHANEQSIPQVDAVHYGWVRDYYSDSLVPKTVAESVSLAPEDILKSDSSQPCKLQEMQLSHGKYILHHVLCMSRWSKLS